MADSYFRGQSAIKEVLTRVQPLAEWTLKFKPEQVHLVLRRTDFDVVKRWPRAASILGFKTIGIGLFYVDPISQRQLELYPDTGPARYQRPKAAEQQEIA